MTTTSTQISFGLFAIEVRRDSTPTATDVQPFVQIGDLKTGNQAYLPFATFEPNFWLLDGNYHLLPVDTSSVHVGLMSASMSNNIGNFGTPVTLDVVFSEVHQTDGLTLTFSEYTNDFATLARIRYYNGVGGLVHDEFFNIGTPVFTWVHAEPEFKHIIIDFYSTNKPYRYLRLLAIDFGIVLTLAGDAIKQASIIESVDPVSAELRTNELDLKLFSTSEQFSIINPGGSYAALQEQQPIAVYEIIDGVTRFMGQYFLWKWESKSNIEIEMQATDLIGQMGQIPCVGGLWLDNSMLTEVLIESILGDNGIPYELDAALVGIPVNGWIPYSTVRDALQQICFAIGATADCSRSWSVKIKPTKIAADALTIDETITTAQKGVSQSLSLKPLISSVEVVAHDFDNPITTSIALFTGPLAVGVYEIVFKEPAHTLTVNNATITASGANFAILTVSAPATVTLAGKTYTKQIQSHRIETAGVTNPIRPVLKVPNATLVTSANMVAVTQRLYDYNQQRYLQKVKLFAPLTEVGDVVLIDTLYSQQIRALVERLEVDLTGGFVVKAEMTGVQEV